MKKFLLFSAAFAAAVLTVGCKKDAGKEAQSEPLVPASFKVQILGTGTKATGQVMNSAAGDAKVNSLQVYVFRGNELEDYKNAGAAMEATLAATSGERTVVALVNAPELTSVATIAELKASVTSLSDNALDGFVMTGEVTQEVVDGAVVPVTVKRLVSRVSVNKISTAFKYMRADWVVGVKGIYLINVSSKNNYGLTADLANAPADAWANKLAHEDAGLDALLYDELTGVNVSNGNPYIAEHAFFPYPNSVSNDDCLAAAGLASGASLPAAWSPRATLLVLDVTLSGKEAGVDFTRNGYYPIVLPALERNKTYIIEEIQITREPSPTPFEPIETGESQITIRVSDWEVGLNLGTVII